MQALILTSWVRNGFFLEPLAQHHLCIQHVQYAEDQARSGVPVWCQLKRVCLLLYVPNAEAC